MFISALKDKYVAVTLYHVVGTEDREGKQKHRYDHLRPNKYSHKMNIP